MTKISEWTKEQFCKHAKIIAQEQCFMCELEQKFEAQQKEINYLKLHKQKQIDENRAVFKNITELEEQRDLGIERIKKLEEWIINHEAEGIQYGNEFEDRDVQLNKRIENVETDLSHVPSFDSINDLLNRVGKLERQLDQHYQTVYKDMMSGIDANDLLKPTNISNNHTTNDLPISTKSVEELYSFEEALIAYKKGHRIKREPHMNWLENLHKNPDHKCRPFLSDILQDDWQIENYSKPKTKTLWIAIKKNPSEDNCHDATIALPDNRFIPCEGWETIKIELPE